MVDLCAAMLFVESSMVDLCAAMLFVGFQCGEMLLFILIDAPRLIRRQILAGIAARVCRLEGGRFIKYVRYPRAAASYYSYSLQFSHI